MVKRKKPLQRKPWRPKKPRKRIPPISDRKKAALADYRKTKVAWLKGVPCCEACQPIHDYLAKEWGDFRAMENRPWSRTKINRPVEDIHHSRGRSGSLESDTRYWVGVCRYCHDWIHQHPAQSREILSTAGVPLIGPWNRPD